MPSITLNNTDFSANEISLVDLVIKSSIVPSKSQARTLIAQGGISVDDKKINDINATINLSQFEKGYVIIKKGKKTFIKIIIKN